VHRVRSGLLSVNATKVSLKKLHKFLGVSGLWGAITVAHCSEKNILVFFFLYLYKNWSRIIPHTVVSYIHCVQLVDFL
jgi:hypothetical protein